MAECRAWPEANEWGEWIALLLAAICYSPQRHAWLRWKLGLDEVPEASCGGCEARKLWLNTLGGRLASSPRWKWLAGLLVRRAK